MARKGHSHADDLRRAMAEMPQAFAPGFKGTIQDADGTVTHFSKGGGRDGSVLSITTGTSTALLAGTLAQSQDVDEMAQTIAQLLERVKAGNAGTMHYPRIREALATIPDRFPGKKKLATAATQLAKALGDT